MGSTLCYTHWNSNNTLFSMVCLFRYTIYRLLHNFSIASLTFLLRWWKKNIEAIKPPHQCHKFSTGVAKYDSFEKSQYYRLLVIISATIYLGECLGADPNPDLIPYPNPNPDLNPNPNRGDISCVPASCWVLSLYYSTVYILPLHLTSVLIARMMTA